MSVEINVTNEVVEINEVSEIVEIVVTGGTGPAGQGVPIGGTTNQVLAKNSNTNYDTVWIDNSGSGVPYTGATGPVTLGIYGLTAGTLTLQPQALNSSTYKITQQMATNDYWSIYGYASVFDEGEMIFELQDNGSITTGQKFKFSYGNAANGSPKDILVMDYNGAILDGTLRVNNLAGVGTRMVVTDTNGTLSSQALPSGGGSVTSVDMSVPTGLTISGNPITSSGTLALGLASGYSIPTTASQATWTTAYNDSIVSAAVTGTTTKTLTLTQQDAGTITATWTDINTDAVTSVFGRTGAVVSAEGDYTLTHLGDVT